MLGAWESPQLTAAFFDQFLGPAPVDPAAKLRVGCGLLFLANGFKCGPGPSALGLRVCTTGPSLSAAAGS